jgi:DNA-binding NarL/FixJ family response regulator
VPKTLQTELTAPADRVAKRPGVVLIGGETRRQAVAAIVEGQGFDFEPVGSVDDLLSVGVNPALVVLWVDDGLSQAVARDLAPLGAALGKTPVVLVCAGIRPRDLRVVLAAGAAGVVLEGRLAAALGPSLQAAWAGQVCVPRQHSEQVEPAALSGREKQILGLVVMGYMNSQIADQLFLAESTVKSHLSSAFAKLGVRSRNEAVELILDSERGQGMGILALGGEPLETIPTAV